MQFFPARPVDLEHLAVCRECACLIVDDTEGANRADHEAFHRGVLSQEQLSRLNQRLAAAVQ